MRRMLLIVLLALAACDNMDEGLGFDARADNEDRPPATSDAERRLGHQDVVSDTPSEPGALNQQAPSRE